ncbi:uncharacterized protein LOC126833854 [Adelges cooleyi]|uniref:uncharacterized protein LOC126833854 n=1 Tax=Adelges cooleyi TaxID=133065 RepID=UPI0021805B5A|nr:uncharacterized protein LOC126833854 [Adelges cooleyi]
MKHILLICLMTLGLFMVNTSGVPVSICDKCMEQQSFPGKILNGIVRNHTVHHMLGKLSLKLQETNDSREVQKPKCMPISSEPVAKNTIFNHPAMIKIRNALRG